MNREKYLKTWEKYLRQYEKRGFKTIQKGIKDSLKGIPWDNMNENNFEAVVSLNVDEAKIKKAFYDMSIDTAYRHGKRVGRAINDDLKFYSADTFSEIFQGKIFEWLQAHAGRKIVTVRSTLIEYVIGKIKEGMNEGLSIPEIAKNIQKLVNRRGFYRWQALRIARTEAMASANYGATISGNASNLVLEKEWISGGREDNRTRRIPRDQFDHAVMDEVKVTEFGFFNVQGDLLRYPGDPNGKAGNVINCRCTVSLVAKRDANGRLMRKN